MKNCEFCNKELNTGKRFCSSKCWYEYQKIEKEIRLKDSGIKIICKFCGKTFYVQPCLKNRLYCCKKCKDDSQKKPIEIKEETCRFCPSCNKIMKYGSKQAADRAAARNTTCDSCCHIGKKNGMSGSGCNNGIKAMAAAKKNKTWEEIYGKEKANKIKQIVRPKHSGKNNGMYGKTHSEKTKEWFRNRIVKVSTKRKQRINMIKRILGVNDKISRFTPNYNLYGCIFFNKLMEENSHIHIQHALNGGEYFIKSLRYWVDGYDKKNNVVYEIDERHHFNKISGELKLRDIIRQQEIEEVLHCKFIRIKYEDIKKFIYLK